MSILFEYPPVAPTNSATLKNPEFGDAEADIFKVNIHLMMQTSAVATQRTPSRQKLLMPFKNVPVGCGGQLQDFDDFMLVVKGRDVKLTDYNGDTWTGKIITNPLDIAHTSSTRCDFTLEFVGVKD